MNTTADIFLLLFIKLAMKYSTWIYFVLICLIFFYLKTNSSIINTSLWFNFTLFGGILLLLLTYNILKKTKRRNTTTYLIIKFLEIIALSFVFYIAIKIPINQYIIYYANQQPIIIDEYQITRYHRQYRRNPPRISYMFVDEKEYRLPLTKSKRIPKQELLSNYKVRLEYSESLLGLYVLKKFKIIKNEKNNLHSISYD